MFLDSAPSPSLGYQRGQYKGVGHWTVCFQCELRHRTAAPQPRDAMKGFASMDLDISGDGFEEGASMLGTVAQGRRLRHSRRLLRVSVGVNLALGLLVAILAGVLLSSSGSDDSAAPEPASLWTAKQDQPRVILISLDGFRWDYYHKAKGLTGLSKLRLATWQSRLWLRRIRGQPRRVGPPYGSLSN